MYAGTYEYGLYLTTDFGDSWKSINSDLPNKNIYKLALDDSTIYAGMWMSGDIYKSSNLGKNWKKSTNGLTSSWINDIIVYKSKVFTATRTGIYESSDRGDSWSLADSNLKTWSFNDFTISGTNIIASSEHGIYKSIDDGENWICMDSTMTDSSQVVALAADDNRIFASTFYNGLFLSTDNGEYWTSRNIGLPKAYIICLAIINNNIFAGTYGSGVYLSTNNGESWLPANSGLTDPYTERFVVIGDYIYAGTAGYGMFKAKLSDFGITSVEEKPVSINDDLNISPNPSDDFISINFKDDARKPDFVRLFDSYGNVVYENYKIEGINFKLNTSGLASGMYMLQIGDMGMRKVVVVH